MSDTTINTLGTAIAQAQSLCAVLERVEQPLEPETLRDYAEVLAGLLERAQSIAIDLHDCEVLPVKSLAQLQRVRALRAEIEAT